MKKKVSSASSWFGNSTSSAAAMHKGERERRINNKKSTPWPPGFVFILFSLSFFFGAHLSRKHSLRKRLHSFGTDRDRLTKRISPSVQVSLVFFSSLLLPYFLNKTLLEHFQHGTLEKCAKVLLSVFKISFNIYCGDSATSDTFPHFLRNFRKAGFIHCYS